jgi:hypothetical protein
MKIYFHKKEVRIVRDCGNEIYNEIYIGGDYYPYDYGFKFLSGDYPCPPDFHGEKFAMKGNSGIAAMRSWTIPIPIVELEIEVTSSLYSVNLTGEKYVIKAYALDFIEELDKFLKEFKLQHNLAEGKKELNKNFANSTYCVIREFNKTRIFLALPYLEGKECLVLHKYRTTCGNLTVLLHKVQSELSIPDNYKGLVIGKGGSNIKELQNKYKINFKIS